MGRAYLGWRFTSVAGVFVRPAADESFRGGTGLTSNSSFVAGCFFDGRNRNIEVPQESPPEGILGGIMFSILKNVEIARCSSRLKLSLHELVEALAGISKIA